MNVKALILTGYGLNCDNETAYAFELASAKPSKVHISSLINGDVKISDFQIMAFVGGFSWGDDHGAGVVQAVRLKTKIGHKIQEFIEKGNLIIGICNGFQTLVNMGILPASDGDYTKRSVALTFNDKGNFIDTWVSLKVNKNSNCIYTKNLDVIELPVRHGEGKFYADTSVIDNLLENNQVVLQYAQVDGTLAKGNYPYNPNGSVYDIAGICDKTGRIFGLMPHPEAFIHPTNHPNWNRYKSMLSSEGKNINDLPVHGIQIFKNAVSYFTS
ncbi:MAG: phosphoribosylformylglycinamidine synthase I [Desulfobacterales bacterium]|nr:phosphoribosylformylglycinamidine synthase I [Desulfobacterales bacterium]